MAFREQISFKARLTGHPFAARHKKCTICPVKYHGTSMLRNGFFLSTLSSTWSQGRSLLIPRTWTWGGAGWPAFLAASCPPSASGSPGGTMQTFVLSRIHGSIYYVHFDNFLTYFTYETHGWVATRPEKFFSWNSVTCCSWVSQKYCYKRLL